jgi:outer membrane protein TolC
MNGCNRARWWRTGLLVVWLWGGYVAAFPQDALDPPSGNKEAKKDDATKDESKKNQSLPSPRMDSPKGVKVDPAIEANLPQAPPSILPETFSGIDLACAFRLAGVENPEILIARQRVVGAEAMRLLAFAQTLPNLNVGINYDAHTGPVQQSDGNILKVNREAMYLGLGSGAIAAGTVNIPGVLWAGNPGGILFDILAARQVVRVKQFDSLAVRNQIFLQVANAYMELLRAEGHRVVALKNRDDAHEIARLTAITAKAGQRRDADANRAAAEYADRINEVVDAENQMLVSSARLAALINLPPSTQLHGHDGWAVPTPIVPEPIPMRELLLIAINRRPELAARNAAIRAATNELRKAQVLPFSPNVWGGLSSGTFGGGSNLASGIGFTESRFGNFAPRLDVDAILYWTAQNMGVGNIAQIRFARNQRRISELELVRDLNMVRNDVAKAYAGIHARFAQIRIAQDSVASAQKAYEEDYKRIVTTDSGLPIELINSFRLLAQGRNNYLDAVVNYDESQFAMYVALGQPPASLLARGISSEDIVPQPPSHPMLPACTRANGAGACDACNNCKCSPRN